MDKVRTVIIEDDIFNIRVVKKIIESQFPEIEIIGTAGKVSEGIQLIESSQPDLLIMDIHLIDGTSFDILRQCNYSSSKIVFMSAYHEYAVKAIQYAAVEFVFKPFDINELVVAIDKALDQLQDHEYQTKIETLINNIDNKPNKVILQGRTSIKAYDVNDIVWCKAVHGGANFYFIDNSYFYACKPLRRYEAILSDHSFFRCHPHYLINLLRVKELRPDLHRIKMETNDEVIYEPRRYNQLKDLLQNNKRYTKTF